MSEVQGFGRQAGHTEVYRGTEYKIDFVPRCDSRSCAPTRTSNVSRTRSCVSSRTGKIGDGKVWVTPGRTRHPHPYRRARRRRHLIAPERMSGESGRSGAHFCPEFDAATGMAWCRRHSDATDQWLRALFDEAVRRRPSEASPWSRSAATAGRSCFPAGDLDVVLLHERGDEIAPDRRPALVPDLGRGRAAGPQRAHRRRRR